MMKYLCRFFLAAATVGAAALPAHAELTLKDNDRIVLFGDASFSEPYFTKFLDLFLHIKYPGLKAQVLRMGGAGTTTMQALEDLDDEVTIFEPTTVLLCFGPEDAERKPFQQWRLDRFVTNLKKIADRIEASGAKVIFVTPPPPEPDKNKGLEVAKYDEVMDQFAAATVRLAEERKATLLDWHAVANKCREKLDHGSLTLDGMRPSPLSIAILSDMLLSRWGAEPINYEVVAQWNGTDDVTATMGTARLLKRDKESITIAISDAPVPLNMPERGSLAVDEWPMSKWCTYHLKIADAPDGGFVISDAGKHAKPFLPEMLREGADLSLVGPLVEHQVTSNLRTRALTKCNQFSKYQASLHRKSPEPELQEGFRLYAMADKAFAIGAYKVLQRMPTTLNAQLEIRKVDAATMERLKNSTKESPMRGPRPRPKHPKKKRD